VVQFDLDIFQTKMLLATNRLTATSKPNSHYNTETQWNNSYNFTNS